MLQVKELYKTFANVIAVDHVSFDISKGQVFGLLGPNGAGKTTTINMICGLLKPNSGQILLDDEELSINRPAIRKHIGVVPQEIALYQDLNALDNLQFWGRLYGLSGTALKSRINELLALVGLKDRATDRVKTYSGGMKRRLNLIAGILHRPKLLLLDEPTVGIDPQARHNILDTIQAIADEGTTLLYTTHYMDEAEDFCQRLAILDHGRILAQGSVGEIKSLVGENTLLRISGRFKQGDLEALVIDSEAKIETVQEGEAVFSIPPADDPSVLVGKIIKSDISISNLQIKEPSLDTVFIKLTGRELRD